MLKQYDLTQNDGGSLHRSTGGSLLRKGGGYFKRSSGGCLTEFSTYSLEDAIYMYDVFINNKKVKADKLVIIK